jgi:hypothetical protein
VSEFTLLASTAMVRAVATGANIHVAISRAFTPGTGRDHLDSVVAETLDEATVAASARDDHAERQAIAALNRRLQQIESAEPGIRAQLRYLIFDVLLPRLSTQEQAKVISTQVSASSDQVINHNFLGTRDHIDR